MGRPNLISKYQAGEPVQLYSLYNLFQYCVVRWKLPMSIWSIKEKAEAGMRSVYQ